MYKILFHSTVLIYNVYQVKKKKKKEEENRHHFRKKLSFVLTISTSRIVVNCETDSSQSQLRRLAIRYSPKGPEIKDKSERVARFDFARLFARDTL